MKQYLLIPISEIDSRIEELNKIYKKQMFLFGNSIADVNISELNSLKSKGEIVEIEDESLNELFKEYSHSNTKQTFESFVVNEKGYKLIKIIEKC